MKRPQYNVIIALILLATVVSSCQKPTVANVSTVVDATNVGLHMNAAMEDVANVVSKSTKLSGVVATAVDTIAGASIDTSQIDSGIITVNYDGVTNVDSRFTRSGSMTIRLAGYPTTHWKDPNAVLNITFNTLKYTNSASGASFTYSGPHQLTNITGGLSYQMLAGISPATYMEYRHTSSAASITFSDGTNLVWNMNRLRTYTNTSSTPTIAVSADQTVSGNAFVEMWGINRQGNQFYNSIITGTQFNQTTCNTDFRDPMGGESRQYFQTFNVRILFGANSNGTLSYLCPWGYQTDYINSISQPNFATYQYWY